MISSFRLRRQHLLECMLFTEKFVRALKANRRLEEPLAAKEALEAMGRADRDLSSCQRQLYLLRGFGRRLPDMPSTTDVELTHEASKAAVRANKVRRMLADYTQELLESNAQLSLEDFLKNLQSSGVMKGGLH